MPARNKARLFNSEVSVWDNRDNLWVSLRGQLLLPSACLVHVFLLLLVFLYARAPSASWCSLCLALVACSRVRAWCGYRQVPDLLSRARWKPGGSWWYDGMREVGWWWWWLRKQRLRSGEWAWAWAWAWQSDDGEDKARRSLAVPSAAGGASANCSSRHQHRPLSPFTVVRLRRGASLCILYRCPACLKEPHTFIYLYLFTQTLLLRQIQ